MNAPTPSRPWLITMVLGVAFLLLGAFVALRPLFTHTILTGARWLDVVFAFFFLLRGVLNVKTAQRRRAAGGPAMGSVLR